jgi:hypothetical protein
MVYPTRTQVYIHVHHIHPPHPPSRMATGSWEITGEFQGRGDVPAHHVTVISLSSADYSRAGSGPPVSSDGYEASSGESEIDRAFPRRDQAAYRDRVCTEFVNLPIEEERKGPLAGNGSSGGQGLLALGRDLLENL